MSQVSRALQNLGDTLYRGQVGIGQAELDAANMGLKKKQFELQMPLWKAQGLEAKEKILELEKLNQPFNATTSWGSTEMMTSKKGGDYGINRFAEHTFGKGAKWDEKSGNISLPDGKVVTNRDMMKGGPYFKKGAEWYALNMSPYRTFRTKHDETTDPEEKAKYAALMEDPGTKINMLNQRIEFANTLPDSPEVRRSIQQAKDEININKVDQRYKDTLARQAKRDDAAIAAAKDTREHRTLVLKGQQRAAVLTLAHRTKLLELKSKDLTFKEKERIKSLNRRVEDLHELLNDPLVKGYDNAKIKAQIFKLERDLLSIGGEGGVMPTPTSVPPAGAPPAQPSAAPGTQALGLTGDPGAVTPRGTAVPEVAPERNTVSYEGSDYAVETGRDPQGNAINFITVGNQKIQVEAPAPSIPVGGEQEIFGQPGQLPMGLAGPAQRQTQRSGRGGMGVPESARATGPVLSEVGRTTKLIWEGTEPLRKPIADAVNKAGGLIQTGTIIVATAKVAPMIDAIKSYFQGQSEMREQAGPGMEAIVETMSSGSAEEKELARQELLGVYLYVADKIGDVAKVFAAPQGAQIDPEYYTYPSSMGLRGGNR